MCIDFHEWVRSVKIFVSYTNAHQRDRKQDEFNKWIG